jgi:hypothetical protein
MAKNHAEQKKNKKKIQEKHTHSVSWLLQIEKIDANLMIKINSPSPCHHIIKIHRLGSHY